jgi:hypothetical protein
MFHSIPYPHAGAYVAPELGTPLLPETLQLLEVMRSTRTAKDLESIAVPNAGRTAFYRACPETSLPFVWFSISHADPNLLAFTGKTAPRFEVLQVRCGGFQYHWRSDLMRAMEEKVPLVSRLTGLSDTRELDVDHLVLPVVTKHGVEIYGWLTFSQDLRSCEDRASLNGHSTFRKSERPSPVQLPMTLACPEGGGTLARNVLGVIRARWRPLRSERHHSENLVKRHELPCRSEDS